MMATPHIMSNLTPAISGLSCAIALSRSGSSHVAPAGAIANTRFFYPAFWSAPANSLSEALGNNSKVKRTTSRDRSNIGGRRVFYTTLLSFVLCNLLYAHEIPAHQS